MANLLSRLIAAGTPADLIEDVALELARARVAQEAIDARRARDRDRQRARRGHAASRDGADGAPQKETPHTPKKNTPPSVSPKGDTSPRRKRAARLPDDFAVPDEWLRWAQARRGWPPAEARDEAECFC